MTRFNIYWQALLKPVFATLELSKFQELVTEVFQSEQTSSTFHQCTPSLKPHRLQHKNVSQNLSQTLS